MTNGVANSSLKLQDIYDKFANKSADTHIRGDGQQLYANPKLSLQSLKIRLGSDTALNTRTQARGAGAAMVRDALKKEFPQFEEAIFKTVGKDSELTVGDIKFIRKEIDRLVSAQGRQNQPIEETTTQSTLSNAEPPAPPVKRTPPSPTPGALVFEAKVRDAIAQQDPAAAKTILNQWLDQEPKHPGALMLNFSLIANEKNLGDFNKFITAYDAMKKEDVYHPTYFLAFTTKLDAYYHNSPSVKNDLNLRKVFEGMYHNVCEDLFSLPKIFESDIDKVGSSLKQVMGDFLPTKAPPPNNSIIYDCVQPTSQAPVDGGANASPQQADEAPQPPLTTQYV